MGVTLLLSNPTTSTSTSHFRSSSLALTTPPSICSSPTTFSTVSWNSNDYNKKCFSVRAQNQKKLGFGCSIPSSRRFTKIRCGVTVIDQTQFTETVLKSELPVLVEFVAEWCGPCRLISPAIEWASQEYKARLKIVKIDHDSNPQLIEEYKVYGLPALIIFKNGQEIPKSRREGAMTKVKLKEYLETFLDSVAVA